MAMRTSPKEPSKDDAAAADADGAETTTAIRGAAAMDPGSSSAAGTAQHAAIEGNGGGDVEGEEAVKLHRRSLEEVRNHYERRGYRVHSGLQFGTEFVLYADDPAKVHSDFAVSLVPEDGAVDWRSMQTLVRSMPGLHKHLILAHMTARSSDESSTQMLEEIVVTSEHAPFRQKRKRRIEAVVSAAAPASSPRVGTQRKKSGSGAPNGPPPSHKASS